MHKTFFWTALLATPLLIGAGIYGRTLFVCCPKSASVCDSNRSECCDSNTTESSGPNQSECCNRESTECCQECESLVAAAQQTGKSEAHDADADRQIVFKVQGLACPAVKGIGCGHMLRPMLASLDKIEGVRASATNYTGTMLRITVASDGDKVFERVGKVLAEKQLKPAGLSGDELKMALTNEQWRETARVGELSAIEFQTLGLHRVKLFARDEKLEKEKTDNLLSIAENLWKEIATDAKKEKAMTPEAWGGWCKSSIPTMLERSKGILSDAQIERFRETLASPCCEEDRPNAPPPAPK